MLLKWLHTLHYVEAAKITLCGSVTIIPKFNNSLNLGLYFDLDSKIPHAKREYFLLLYSFS